MVCVPIREKIWGCSILWRGKKRDLHVSFLRENLIFQQFMKVLSLKSFLLYGIQGRDNGCQCVYCSRQLHVATCQAWWLTWVYKGWYVPFWGACNEDQVCLIVKSVVNHLIPSEEALDYLIFSGSKLKLQWDVIDLLIFAVQRSPWSLDQFSKEAAHVMVILKSKAFPDYG